MIFVIRIIGVILKNPPFDANILTEKIFSGERMGLVEKKRGVPPFSGFMNL